MSFDDNQRVWSREKSNCRVSRSLKCYRIIYCIGLSYIPRENNHNVGEEGIDMLGAAIYDKVIKFWLLHTIKKNREVRQIS